MTTRYASGTAVSSGYYYDARRWAVVPVAHDGDRLPGDAGEYVRIPTAAALAAAPVLGGLFLVFLPFIGFALLARAAARPVLRRFGASARELAGTVTPGWKPGEAHFTGGERPEDAGERREARLDALAKEIEERRRNGGR